MICGQHECSMWDGDGCPCANMELDIDPEDLPNFRGFPPAEDV